MKILLVGNSFSVDVSTYIHQIALSAGIDLDVYVLYIPGCPINLHYKNLISGQKAYEFYKNGEKNPFMWCSIQEGLKYQKWNYMTFQQRSSDSGDEETFFPELPLLMNGIREYSNAQYVLHMTWSYAKTFSHEKYGSNPMDQESMDKDIISAYDYVSKILNLPYIIPTGIAIKEARKVFGDNLTRDGFHLNEMGRTLAGYLWAYYFLGLDKDFSKFRPSGYSYDDVTGPVTELELKELMKIAKQVLLENKGHNLNG